MTFIFNLLVYVLTYISLGLQYSKINSIKSPASGTSKVSEPMVMSQVWKVLKVVCA